MSDYSIKTRVLMISVVPLCVTMLALSSLFLWNRVNDIDNALRDRGQAMAAHLASASEYGVFSGNTVSLKQLVDAAILEPDTIEVSIAGFEDDVMVTSLSPVYYDEMRVEKMRRGLVTFEAQIYQPDTGINDALIEPVPGEDAADARARLKPIGNVMVTLSKRRSIEQQRGVLINGLVITFSVLILTVFVAMRLIRGLVSPLEAIINVVNAVRRGDLDRRVESKATGELMALKSGVNAMTMALQDARLRERKLAEDAVYLEKIKAQVTLESIGEGVITTDIDGRITYMNQAASVLTGLDPTKAKYRQLGLVFRVKSRQTDEYFEYPVDRCLRDGETIRHESSICLATEDDEEYVIRDTATPIRDREDNVIGMVLVIQDFSHIQKMSDQLMYQASHDDLTGLFNRRAFEKQINSLLSNDAGEQRQHAMCYIDLDQFKIVNDTCGHVAGDELLLQISEALHENLRQSDVVARLGGDEFGVLFRDCSLSKALELAEALRLRVASTPFAWDDYRFEVGASIGLVPFEGSESLTQIMVAADAACYIAKDKGRNCIHVYQEADDAILQRSGEMQWYQKLKNAINENRFVLYCQGITPIASKQSVRANYYEILLRMQKENGELICPDQFLPVAERYRMMPEIDRWVIGHTFATMHRSDLLCVNADCRLIFNINLSGQSLGDDMLLDFVLDQYEKYSVDPAMIIFEITETSAIANMSKAIEFISAIRRVGGQFALDDFGSGLSSFGYLKDLPLDYIKIDGKFVHNMHNNPVNEAIVESINHIGHVMGLKTIAEIVENQEILDRLQKIEVDFVQGFYLDRPAPLEKILESLCLKKTPA